MDILSHYISILNWIEPRFSLQKLNQLKQLGSSLNESYIIKLFVKKESLNELYLLLDDLCLSLKRGNKILCSLDKNYPAELNAVLRCPTPLMFRGQLNLSRFNLSVVGSRKPSLSSLEWLKGEFYQGLLDLKAEKKDLNVMSGGAYGIDQKSHKVSLLSATPTVCFLPSGINQFYPANIEPMIHQIEMEGGVVISPFPPNHPIFKSNFYYRNRILVLLSDLVFVVEARRRSGTMMTANLAAKLGKSVIVLPHGPEPSFLGGLDLICAGAAMIRCKDDLIFQIQQTPQYNKGGAIFNGPLFNDH